MNIAYSQYENSKLIDFNWTCESWRNL